MTKYKFSLQAVENVRAVRRDQARAALAEAYQAERMLADKQAGVATEQVELLTLQRAVASAQHPDLGRLSEAQQYGLVLRSRQQELANQQALLGVEVERRRRALVEAERDVRALELLDKRQRFAHARDQRRAEAKQFDEVATSMRWRNDRSER
jgi:flagellar export protein FliJ